MPRQTAWIVDPLGGSETFVAGIPYFGPAVGLLQGERITAGGVLPAFSSNALTFFDGGRSEMHSMCVGLKVAHLSQTRVWRVTRRDLTSTCT
jgi:fructose-1,6-bisphosphatase/inositol monophosphatase family enzyme